MRRASKDERSWYEERRIDFRILRRVWGALGDCHISRSFDKSAELGVGHRL
jgi:hypothetical protein